MVVRTDHPIRQCCKIRVSWKDDGLFGGVIQIYPQIRTERSHQDPCLGQLLGRDDITPNQKFMTALQIQRVEVSASSSKVPKT
ncbi:hypothetical protein CR513_11973, partial [Mucuna pruriens]